MAEYSKVRDLNLELNDLERRILEQETAIRANKSSISIGGLTIVDGDLRLQDGGDLYILGGGNLHLDENSTPLVGGSSIVPFKIDQVSESRVGIDANNITDVTLVATAYTPRPETARSAAVIIEYSVQTTHTRVGHRQESYSNSQYIGKFSNDSKIYSRIVPTYTTSYSGNVVTQFAGGYFTYYYDGSNTYVAPVTHSVGVTILSTGATLGTFSASGSISATVLWFM